MSRNAHLTALLDGPASIEIDTRVGTVTIDVPNTRQLAEFAESGKSGSTADMLTAAVKVGAELTGLTPAQVDRLIMMTGGADGEMVRGIADAMRPQTISDAEAEETAPLDA